jgi:hypothetical protein
LEQPYPLVAFYVHHEGVSARLTAQLEQQGHHRHRQHQKDQRRRNGPSQLQTGVPVDLRGNLVLPAAAEPQKDDDQSGSPAA